MAWHALRALNKDSTGKSVALTSARPYWRARRGCGTPGRVSTLAQLPVETLAIEAGQSATVTLNVSNTGDVVEDYEIEIRGDPSLWTTVDPPRFTLYPGTSRVATLDVHPPRSPDVPAGELRMGVLVVPTEHPELAVTPEAVVEVLPFLETTAELVPRMSHGRFGAKHQVAVDNRGNVPVTVTLVPTPGSDALRVEAIPESLTVDPGRAAFGDVQVRPAQRLWKGVPRTIPFTLGVFPTDSPSVVLDAGHVQDPVFPAWTGKALLALLGALVALAALWFLLLRPTIESAAKEAVAEPVKTAQEQAAAAQEASQQAQAGQAGAQQAAGSAQAAASAVAGAPPPKTVTAPFSGRLEVAPAAPKTESKEFKVPASQSLSLTDFVLENPQGDTGVLKVTLNDTVLLTQALESFRTTDYHFRSPFVAKENSTLRLTVTCNEVGKPPATTAPTACANAVTFGGEMTQPAG